MTKKPRRILVTAGLATAASIITAQAMGALSGLPASAQSSNSPDTCQGSPGHPLGASSSVQLEAILKCAKKGTRVELTAGTFGKIHLDGVDGLTLVAKNPASPPLFDAISVDRSRMITLKNLRFSGDSGEEKYYLRIQDSEGVEALSLIFDGTAATSKDVRSAVLIRSSKNISLSNSLITWTSDGIQFVDVDNLNITNNIIHDFGSDAIHGTSSERVTISKNYISSAHPSPGDHPDGIQIFTVRDKPSSDISVTENLIERGHGDPFQGIFVTDETNSHPFVNVRLLNNLIVGSLYNGIMVSGADSGSVQGNTVVPLAGQENWIILVKAASLTFNNNTAQSLIRDRSKLGVDAPLGNNRRFAMRETAARAAIDAWKARNLSQDLPSN